VTSSSGRQAAPPTSQRLQGRRRPGDMIFSSTATVAGSLILATLAGVTIFLLVKAWPAVTASAGDIPGGEGLWHYTYPLLYGTVLASVLALVIATPLAVGIALFISHYAPRGLSQGFGYLVDLLAAIPSVIYGLWGIAWLAPLLQPSFIWLEKHLGFVPFFAGPASATGRTMFTTGIVLAVMILPIMSAICREVFLQTPRLHEEAALALGATRWEMVRLTVLPHGRSGVISGAMLGLGRALGETMAVALVLSVGGGVSLNLIAAQNPSTIAANIALNFPESTGLDINTLIATGLVLFFVTFLVNMAARAIVGRRKEFSGADA